MLVIRAINKFYDKDGKLYGYEIQDVSTNQTMRVRKEELKSAIINKQCIAENLTLTSDGRLIGSARPKPVYKQPQQLQKPTFIPYKLLEVYTTGRNISGALVDNGEDRKLKGVPIPTIKGIQPGCMFYTGVQLKKLIDDNMFTGLQIVDGKPSLQSSDVKRKSFSKIKDRLIKILVESGISSDIQVTKQGKSEYIVTPNNYTYSGNSAQDLINIYLCLICHELYTNKVKVLDVNKGTVLAGGYSNISDIRKALKPLKF